MSASRMLILIFIINFIGINIFIRCFLCEIISNFSCCSFFNQLLNDSFVFQNFTCHKSFAVMRKDVKNGEMCFIALNILRNSEPFDIICTVACM
jgi:hypothetical protein